MPTVMYVSNSSVTLKFQPPEKVDEFRRLDYVIQFRRYESHMWIGLWHLCCEINTVYGLNPDSLYSFGVAAKYKGGDYGPFSDTVHVQTEPADTGKCYCMFVSNARRYISLLFGISCSPKC